jgi:DNA-directed RNA polymerase specialized sigma24 family protein
MLRVKAGDLDKMGLLFERYNRPLFAFFYHMTHKPDASEDLVQNVF